MHGVSFRYICLRKPVLFVQKTYAEHNTDNDQVHFSKCIAFYFIFLIISKVIKRNRLHRRVLTHGIYNTACNRKQIFLWKKCTSFNRNTKTSHWKDYMRGSFPNSITNDTKKTLHMLRLYIPLSAFWSLFDQQVNINIDNGPKGGNAKERVNCT